MRPRLAQGVRVEPAGDRDGVYLLVHPDAPRWAALNATGLEVARLCDGTRTTGEIAAVLAGRYAVELPAVSADLVACLADLERAGLLEGPPAQPRAMGGGWRLHLYLTERCNLRCVHCGVADHPPAADLLSGEMVHALVDQAAAAGCEGIAFGGGEPLLREDCLELLRASAARVHTLLATNGWFVDEPGASALVEAGVLVQVSLDGATGEVHDAIRGPGAFERAWQAIERLQRAGIGQRLSLNVTLMRSNIRQAREIVALASERGISGGVRFTQLQRMGRAAQQWERLAPTPEQYAEAYRTLYSPSPAACHPPPAVSPGLPGLEMEPPGDGPWCRLGRLLLVDAQGDVYPCSLLTGPQFRLGNVAEQSLAVLLHSEALAQWVDLCRGRRDQIAACRACAWRAFCQAGCPGSTWCMLGTWYATDGLCELRRELYRTLIARRGMPASSAECLP